MGERIALPDGDRGSLLTTGRHSADAIVSAWDKMFGTFVEEDERVKFGVYPRINSVNPVTVFFHGFAKFGKQLWNAPTWSYRFKLVVKPPIWAWGQEQQLVRQQATK